MRTQVKLLFIISLLLLVTPTCTHPHNLWQHEGHKEHTHMEEVGEVEEELEFDMEDDDISIESLDPDEIDIDIPDQAEVEQKRKDDSQRFISCIVLTNQKQRAEDTKIGTLLGKLPTARQQEIIQKMYASAMENCFTDIELEVSQKQFSNKIYQALGSSDDFQRFDWGKQFHYLGFEIEPWFEEDADLTLNQMQEQLMESVEKFNENQRRMKEEEEDDDEVEIDRVPSIGGFSLEDLTGEMGIYYVMIVVGLISLGFYYGKMKHSLNQQLSK